MDPFGTSMVNEGCVPCKHQTGLCKWVKPGAMLGIVIVTSAGKALVTMT